MGLGTFPNCGCGLLLLNVEDLDAGEPGVAIDELYGKRSGSAAAVPVLFCLPAALPRLRCPPPSGIRPIAPGLPEPALRREDRVSRGRT